MLQTNDHPCKNCLVVPICISILLERKKRYNIIDLLARTKVPHLQDPETYDYNSILKLADRCQLLKDGCSIKIKTAVVDAQTNMIVNIVKTDSKGIEKTKEFFKKYLVEGEEK